MAKGDSGERAGCAVENWTLSLWSEADRCQAGEARSPVLMLIPDKEGLGLSSGKTKELQQPRLIMLECLCVCVCALCGVCVLHVGQR